MSRKTGDREKEDIGTSTIQRRRVRLSGKDALAMAPSPFADLAESCRRSPPRVVLILGSGMGDVARQMANPIRVSFADIPGMPAAGVHGHKGCLTLGEWSGRRVLLFEGRLHF